MDIWSVVNWDIAYTDERGLPYEMLRRMSTLSALLYLVDHEFMRIRDERTENVKEFLSKSAVGGRVELSSRVATALSKRGITFDVAERELLAEYMNRAEQYCRKSGSLRDEATMDALALYLFDRERFTWIVNERAIRAVEQIDRTGVDG